jgi:hypothetical protein
MTKQNRIIPLFIAAMFLFGPASVGAAAARGAAAVPARSSKPARPAADTSSCKAVFDATSKTLETPNHSYMDGLGAAGKGEMITVNGDRYLLVNGKWSKSRMTVAATKAQEEENIKTAKVISCKRIGDELVGGDAATVYSEHSETADTKSDGEVWISKTRGVLLKNEIELDSGDATKQHITIRYEYGNVKAPI